MPEVLLRVVNWNPSRLKYVRSRGSDGVRRLASSAMAVTFHTAYMHEGALLVQLQPSRRHLGMASPIHVVEDVVFHLYETGSLLSLRVWSGSGDVDSDGFFAFSHDVPETREIAQELLEHRAFDEDSSITLVAPPAQTQALVEAGFTQQVAGAGREAGLCKNYMTQRGLQELVACQRLSTSALATDVRGHVRADLSAATTYELLSLLHDKGFQWKENAWQSQADAWPFETGGSGQAQKYQKNQINVLIPGSVGSL